MKKFYIFVLAVLSMVIARSQKIWDGPVGGSWTTPSFWSGGTVPVPTDVVKFGAGISGTITDVPNMSIAGLIIEGGNVTFTQTGGGTNTLTITNGTAAVDFSITTGSSLILSTGVNISLNNGTGMNPTTASFAGLLSLNGRVYNTNGGNVITNVLSTGVIQVFDIGSVTSNSAAKLTYADGATYEHARNGGTIPTATWAAGSKINITGITDAAPGGLSNQSFGDFEWNSDQAAHINLDGGLRTVKGDLKIAKTSANTATRFLNLGSSTNYTLAIGGDLIIEQAASDSTNVSFINDGDGDAVINVAGNYNHEDGNLLFVNVNADGNDGTAILNLTGNLTQSGGDINFTEGINAGPAGQKGRLNIKGNLSQTGGTIRTTTGNDLIPNGLITFNKTGVQTFNVTDPAGITYTNYIVAAGSTLQLASDLRITRDEEDVFPNWVGKFTVNSGAVLDASTFVIGSQIVDDVEFPELAFANFNLLAGGKIITANDEGVEGSVDTTDHLLASFSSEADYEFQGASTGAFITTPTANTIRDIVVNRTGDLTLAMPITVARELILADGLLSTTEANLLTIGPFGTATPATTTSFVNGPLAKTGTTAFTFPVGKTGAGFRNIGITAPSATATFRAEFFRDITPGGTLASGLVRVSSCEYWDLTKTAGGTGVSASVILSWEANSTCGSGYVTDPTTLRVAHLLSGVWVNEGRESSTGDNTAGTITSSEAPTNFSPFALASSSASENPLPVLFADVKAYEKNDGVQIEWSNLTEKDVAGYTIERSANGSDFSAIARQLPAANQNDRTNYSIFDPTPDAGINFYRIKAEETTGKIVYSNVLSVNLGKSVESFRLYPNPVTSGQVTISLSNIKRGLYTLRVINTAGQDVFRQTITSHGRTITQTLGLPSVLKPGTYHMAITGEGYHENKMFIIR